MPKAYPVELRERVAKAVLEKGLTYAEAAERFDIGRASVSRYVRGARKGSLEPGQPGNPRTPFIVGEVLEQLLELVRENREDTLDELRDKFEERTGHSVSRPSIGRALRRAGITRKKRPSKQKNGTPSES